MKSVKITTNKGMAYLIFSLISLILITAVIFISCGDSVSQDNQNANQNGENPFNDTESEPDTVWEYIFPEGMDGGGSSFTIAAPTTTWFFYTDIVRDEISGEVLDDAIYNRG